MAFLDSDVILELLLDRAPFVADAAHIFALGERKEIELYTSTVSFLNIYYVAARLKGKEPARREWTTWSPETSKITRDPAYR